MTPNEKRLQIEYCTKHAKPVWAGEVPCCGTQCPLYGDDEGRNDTEQCDFAKRAAEDGAPEMCWDCAVCIPVVHYGLKNGR